MNTNNNVPLGGVYDKICQVFFEKSPCSKTCVPVFQLVKENMLIAYTPANKLVKKLVTEILPVYNQELSAPNVFIINSNCKEPVQDAQERDAIYIDLSFYLVDLKETILLSYQVSVIFNNFMIMSCILDKYFVKFDSIHIFSILGCSKSQKTFP